MSVKNCPKESAVAKAARSGDWDEALRAHASQCRVCREVKDAARWMHAFSSDASEVRDLPDPAMLWRRAPWQEKLLERQAQAEKARLVLAWAEFLPLLVAGLGLAVWAMWNGQAVETASAWLVAWLSPQTWLAAFYAASASSIASWISIGAGSLAGIIFASRIVSEG
jgi:hypothetical protein